jgi:hypothetical protein
MTAMVDDIRSEHTSTPFDWSEARKLLTAIDNGSELPSIQRSRLHALCVELAGVGQQPERAAALLIECGPLAKRRAMLDDARLLFAAYETIYATQRSDHATLKAMNDIYNALPSSEAAQSRTQGLAELARRTDRWALHLTANELLAARGLAQPMTFFRAADAKGARRVMRRLAYSLVARSNRVGSDGATAEQWRRLHADVRRVGEALPLFDAHHCDELVVGALLAAQRWDVAAEALATLDDAAALVLEAAQAGTNAAASLDDPALHASRRALSLVRTTPAIAAELRLLDTCRAMSGFRAASPRRPLELRLCSDRLALLARVLLDDPDAYRDHSRFSQLAHLFGNHRLCFLSGSIVGYYLLITCKI